jgi:hypothetical protein
VNAPPETVTWRAGFPPGCASTIPERTVAGRPVKRIDPVAVELRLAAIT